MMINFTKMHGLGNDFVVIDLITNSAKFRTSHIQRISDRRLGVGCDQLLLIDPPIRKTADFFYRIYNADGQEVEQCGNGARCAARFFYDLGFTNGNTLEADCLAGTQKFTIEDNHDITVEMGRPKFNPPEIPFKASIESPTYTINLENQTVSFSIASLGNPHAIIQVSDIQTAPVTTLGPLISQHASFPQGTNVEFMQVIDKNHIFLKVYERGVGETLACGSGACAAVATGIRLKLLESPVKVSFKLGELHITWETSESPIFMTGPTTSVYIGRFRL